MIQSAPGASIPHEPSLDTGHDLAPRTLELRDHRTIGRIARWAKRHQNELLLACSIVSAAVIMGGRLDHGWYHHDDGALAQSAERVLDGELPQRDFIDPSTGLLSFQNAAVFALLGHDMFNLRLPAFALFLLCAACVFEIARRLISPVWAFVAALAAIGWSYPIYPTPIASWYLLFFATIGVYTALRYFETGRRRWLVLTGALGGLAIAYKIVGLWFLVAVALVLLARPFLEGAREPIREVSRRFRFVVVFSAVAALCLVAAVLGKRLGSGEFAELFLPLAALCCAISLAAARDKADGEAARRSLGDVAILALGAAAPLVGFLIPYMRTGSLPELYEGVFVAPQERFEFNSWPMPPAETIVWAAPVVALFLARRLVSRRWRLLVDVVGTSLVLYLVVTAAELSSNRIMWESAKHLGPVAIVVAAVAIAVRRGVSEQPSRLLVCLVGSVAGFASLVQFPFSADVYYCYVAPLVLLTAIAALTRTKNGAGLFPAALLLALAFVGLPQLYDERGTLLGVRYNASPEVAVLDAERASMEVPEADKQTYDRVRALVAAHSRPGDAIFAGPDLPEVYFLTRRRNVTVALFDFLDRSHSTRGQKLIRLLRDEHIPVVVINEFNEQSPPLAPGTLEEIRAMYPEGERVGRFEVRWLSA